jgi:O-antigen biosynthesis protein
MQKSILFLSNVWPEPNATAAGKRMVQLLEVFVKNNFKVVYAATNDIFKRKNFTGDTQINFVSIHLNDSSVEDFFENINPHIVVFDRFNVEEQFGWRVKKVLPNSIRVLDTEDLHFLRYARQQAYKKQTIFDINNDITYRELASMYRCDVSIIISRHEMQFLERLQFPKNLLYYFPLCMEMNTGFPEFFKKKDFLFIGNFYHAPNVAAVKFLKEKIWPLIRLKLQNVNLHIYGAYINQHINQMHQPKEGFIVHGYAESSIEVISQARVMLAPLYFGAGIKGKLLEAMSCNTPSVTTPIGAEGISDVENWPGFVTEDALEFVENAIFLYNDETVWYEKVVKGTEIIKNSFQLNNYAVPFINYLQSLDKNINLHRSKNILGNMLYFHTLKSTEYMAKYIEAKNKLS